MDVIKPIFRDLADTNLLKKCLHGRTQNPNECVNSVIWNRLPKTVFVGLSTLQLGLYDAVSTFNQGNITKCKVLQVLVSNVGCRTVDAMLRNDLQRLRYSEISEKKLTQRARQGRRGAKRRLQDELEEDEDNPSYGAGMH